MVGPLTIIAFAAIAYALLKKCKPGNLHECCTDGCDLYYKNYRLHNNLWGKGPNESLTSCVNYYDGNGKSGWGWNRPNPLPQSGLTYINPIYPEIMVGRQPWESTNTWTELPKKVSNISSFKFDLGYNYLQKPTTGLMDLAYDIWFVDTTTPQTFPTGLYAEIAIWIDCGLNCQPGTYIGDFNDGYNNYKIYYVSPTTIGPWPNWPQWIYIAFVRQIPSIHSGQTYYSVDFKKIIDYIKTKGIAPLISYKYIHGIELGNEINQGSGKIEINKYNLSLNGKNINLIC